MRVDKTYRLSPSSDSIGDLAAVFAAGIKDIVLATGEWTMVIEELTSTTANSLQPPSGTKIRGEHGTVIGWSQDGSDGYWPIFVLIDRTDVEISDLVFEHSGDYLTAHAATANMWGRSAFYDARTQHYVIAATGADRLKLHNLRSAGATRSDTYGGMVYIHGSADIDFSDLHIEDHVSGILTGSDVSGKIDGLTFDYQSTKGGIHYGPGHGLYCFSDGLTVSNITDHGNVSTHESYPDGATVKWKTGGATDRSNVKVDGVYSARAAGALDLFGLRGSKFSRVVYEYMTTHPGFADAEAAIAMRSGGGEVSVGEITLDDVQVRIGEGDVTALLVNASNVRVSNFSVDRTIAADDYTNPWVWVRGTRNEIDVVLNDRTGQSTSYQAPAVQLDGASADNVIQIRRRSGFRVKAPKVIVSDVAESGSVPVRCRVDLVDPVLPQDGYDLDNLILEDGTTLAEAMANDYLIGGRPSFINRTATTDTSISEVFPSGLRRGVHLVAMTLQSGDAEHSVRGLLQVTFDDRTNDWTSAVLLGSWSQKGTAGNTPATPTVAVDNAGNFTVTGTRAGTVALDIRWGAVPMIGLDQP